MCRQFTRYESSGFRLRFVDPVNDMTIALRPGGNIFSAAIKGATKLIDETGEVASLDDVAAVIQICPHDLRAVVPDLCTLLQATAESALMLLQDTCVRLTSATSSSDPIQQFTALAEAYVEWAYQHPQEFRIIGSMPAEVFENNPNLMRYENAIHEVMYRILQRARQQGTLPHDQDIAQFIAIAHTFAYGIVSKMLLGDLQRWNPGMSGREAARHNLTIFINQFLRRAA